MLEKVYGKSRNPAVTAQLEEQLDTLELTGTLYMGYPILASADEAIFVEALLVTLEHGLVVFSLATAPPKQSPQFWPALQDSQDKLYYAMENNLGRHQSLRRKRRLGVPITVVTYFPVDLTPPPDSEVTVAGPGTLVDVIQAIPPLDDPLFRPLNAALQRVSTIKPVKKRTSVSRAGSRGAILKQIEQEIANLDQWQKRAAIETPDGPQRVRGLAGSGKTVVLALKAAYLHTQHPDWTIAVTFHSRSLYQQLTDLIRRFTYEHANDEPNYERLRILHSWGSTTRPGLYGEIANHFGLPRRDFLFAKSKFGMERAFLGVCEELWSAVKDRPDEPLYDAVLIDEAQDLPWPFFHLVYKLAAEPKRIVWAYDELQNLSNMEMPSTDQLFGVDAQGKPRISLVNSPGQARQDIILPVCYRNTPWALTLAHSLGFGVYRKELVQHFDEPSLWQEVGYDVASGELEPGHEVELVRRSTSYPPYFADLMQPDDAVQCVPVANNVEQTEWVARNIAKNLKQDELEADDILIIFPDSLTANRLSKQFVDALGRYGIRSHMAGVTTSIDEMFTPNSVAMSHIYRAKGNEAPMAYVVNCQHCAGGYELIKVRNILFTAITRSRAWVRLCGYGEAMSEIKREFDAVVQHGFRLSFKIPTPGENKRLRSIHRDRSASERAEIRKAEKGLKQFLDAMEKGEVALELLPPEMQRSLRRLLEQNATENDT